MRFSPIPLPLLPFLMPGEEWWNELSGVPAIT